MPEQTQKNIRTFYTIILTQTLSLIGSRISTLAIGIYIFQDTQNATPLTLVAFFSVLPMVLASNVAGMLADRWDRRKVMILADAGQAVGTSLLLISFLSGDFQLWHLYTVAAVNAIFGVFQGPAFQASVTMLIPDDKRDRANAVQQLTGPLSGIIAPAIAAVIYAAFGVEGAIMIDLLTFVIAMVVIFSVHIPRPEQTEEGRKMAGGMWKQLTGGFQYLLQNRILLSMMLYVSMLNFLVGGVSVLNTPYVLARTGNDEIALGIVLSITNLGGIVGAVIIGAWGGTRPRMYTVLPALLVSSASLAIFGITQNTPLLAVFAFLFMMPLPIVNTLFMSIMQAKIPPDLQGRVFAVLGQLSMVLTPVAYLLAGPLADNVFEPAVSAAGWEAFAPVVGTGAGSGMGLMLVIGGGSVFVLTLIVIAIRPLRELESVLPDYVPVAAGEAVTDMAEMGPAPAQPDVTGEAVAV